MNISTFHDCANCGACHNICPTGAITVKEDGLFYTPAVDEKLCIDCERCVHVCPVNHDLSPSGILDAYAAVNKDQKVVAASSSGGAFSAIAEWMLKQGGTVFSAAFSEDYRKVKMISSDTLSLERLRRSKYVESLVGDCFERIREQLSHGDKVLFCGTPCQVAGLKRFLDKDDDGLLTCDFLCGGLPSHLLYNEYIDHLETKYRSRVRDVNFRPKSYGWREYALKIVFENGKTLLKQASLDPYFSAFLRGKLSVRDYCLRCKFPSCRQSDIVLGDCWPYSRITQKQDDDTGISIMIANSEKGKKVLLELSDSLSLLPIKAEQAAYTLNCEKQSNENLLKRERYLEECVSKGVVKAGQQYSVAKGAHAIKILVRGRVKKHRDRYGV